MEQINLYGENKRFFNSTATHKLIVGPTASGKTFAAMLLIHLTCLNFPNTKVLMGRKSLPALRNNAFQIYKQVVSCCNDQGKLKIYQPNRPTNVKYKNYSEIILSSISSSGASLGAEYDIIYINQIDSEGLTYDEAMLTASRARLNNTPYRQVIFDSNLPLDENFLRTHWMYSLESKGFEVFTPTLQDNPALYNWTDLGREYIKSMEELKNSSPRQYATEFGTY